MATEYSKKELEQMSSSELEQAVKAESSESTGKGSSLSTEQMALLNTLMYCDMEFTQDRTLGEILSDIKCDEEDWNELLECAPGHLDKGTTEDVIEAIMNDEELCSLRVANATDYEKGSGNPVNVCFVNENSKEAIVAYCGTRGREWLDNGEAFMGEDSKLQREAAEFLQESIKDYGLEEYDITVTGHSKGGNKAQYAAIMCPEVDNCYSFDGQGFSREFIVEHFDEIIENKGKINSYVADGDYVNPLGIEVAQNLEIFKTNGDINGFDPFAHTPDAYYNFDKDGNIVMNDKVNHRIDFAEAVHDTALEIMDYPRAEREECFIGTMGLLQNFFSDNPISEGELPNWLESGTGTATTIYHLVNNMNDGALDKFFDDPLQTVSDVVEDFLDNPVDFIFDAQDSIENVTDYIEEMGEELLSQGYEKLKDGVGDAIDAAGDFFDGVKDTVGDVVDGVKDTAGDVADTVGDFFDGAKDTAGDVADAVGDFFDGVKDTAGDVADAVGDLSENVGNTIGDFVGDIGDGIRDFAGDVKDSVGGFVDNIKDDVGDFADDIGAAFGF